MNEKKNNWISSLFCDNYVHTIYYIQNNCIIYSNFLAHYYVERCKIKKNINKYKN